MFDVLLERAAEKDLRRLSKDVHGRVVTAIASLAEEEALKAGLAEKATEFNEAGAELYAKA